MYKAEKYIHRCVDSILAQTFTDFELILIDDGSPDNSGAICDEYAAKDPRVKVVHKVNGGVAAARQSGMDKAVGEYTIHADPDDWVEPTMLEELYGKAVEEDADMVVCDYYTYRHGKRRYVSQASCSMEPDVMFREYLGQKLHGSLWNKLVRREIYTKYGISFHNEIIRWEDLYIVCSILFHPVKVAYLPKAFYNYDLSTNPNSIVRNRDNKGLRSMLLFVEHFQKILPPAGYEDELYKIKVAAKEFAFESRIMTENEVRELYSEVNQRYIDTVSRKDLRKLCFSRFLAGRYDTYQRTERARLWLKFLYKINLVRKFRKIFKI